MNKNIVLDGKQFTNKEVFHDIMVKEFDLPSYYGRNLDALWDLLSEKNDLTILIMNAQGIEQNLGDYGKSALKLFDDLNSLEGFKVDYIFSTCYMNDLNYESKNTKKKEVKREDSNAFTVKSLDEDTPNFDDSVYLAEGSRLSGKITIGENSSVWYNAVIRADENEVIIGKNSNVQDNAVIHQSEDSKVEIGDNVTIGHTAIVHGAKIEDNVIIGMGATVLDNAVIGKNSIVGANSLVTKGKEIPEGVLVVGIPAKIVRKLTDDEVSSITENAQIYVNLAKKHKKNAI